MEKLIDINKLSELLSVRPATLYGWVHEGCVPCYKLDIIGNKELGQYLC
ncbi:helix-turn-helix domain-containing protein [bacterium]|nr:helix-turn-helix domain-containing protein [bacterium]